MKAPPSRVSKSALTPDGWRQKFKPVYERDQCLPGAFYAVLVSADMVLGTRITSAYDMGDLNRKLRYQKGAASPADALKRKGLGRWLKGFGLEVQVDSNPRNAFARLEESTKRDDVSFSLVGVELEFVSDYDPLAKIKGASFKADHAIVVLKADGQSVEFFDPTFRPPPPPAVTTQQVPTNTFLKRWSACEEAYYRAWVCRPALGPPRTRDEGLRAVSLFGDWRRKGRGGVR